MADSIMWAFDIRHNGVLQYIFPRPRPSTLVTKHLLYSGGGGAERHRVAAATGQGRARGSKVIRPGYDLRPGGACSCSPWGYKPAVVLVGVVGEERC